MLAGALKNGDDVIGVDVVDLVVDEDTVEDLHVGNRLGSVDELEKAVDGACGEWKVPVAIMLDFGGSEEDVELWFVREGRATSQWDLRA